VPAPPDNIQIDVPAPNPNLTTRERYAMHRTNPACGGCHTLLDPIGLGFENYDAIGRYRETENGKMVDATGELAGTTGSDGAFRGAAELGARLGPSWARASRRASSCPAAWSATG
jgi:hypothetical protein